MTETRNDRLSWFDWAFVSLMVLGLIGFIWYWYQSNYSRANDHSVMNESWSNVLVLDIYALNHISEETILEGNAMLLLSPEDSESSIGTMDLATYADTQNFQRADLLTNIVDPTETTPQDPIFSKLRLLLYDAATHERTLVPLYQAGIRALAIYRAPFLLHLRINSTDALQVVGYAVMSDGSQRLLHLVPMGNSHLKGQAVQGSD